KIPANVWKVGIFVDDGPDTIARVALDADLDVAQLYGIAAARGIRVWRACRITDTLDPYIADDGVEAMLLDTPSQNLHGGTGQTFDWSQAKGIPKKTIIAGGLDDMNVRLAI